jgi:DNA repair exonuclease SbcCD ATPase subunit
VKPHTTSGLITTCLLVLICCVNCAVPTLPKKVSEPIEATEGERFFQYFAYIRALPREALRQELARQESAFAQSRSDEDRLQLALLLSLPDTDFGNRLYALELLQAYLNEPEQPHTRSLDIAVFLVTFIQTTKQNDAYASLAKRLQEALNEKEREFASQQQLNKKLRDEIDTQHSLHNSLGKQLQEALSEKEHQLAMQQQLNKKLQDEKKNVKRLQEKIEKIKDIEKSLIEREQRDNKGT